jgi:hypothetical protein
MLLTMGGEEGLGPDRPDWFNFGGLAPEMTALAARLPNLTFEMVEGANHTYIGKAPEIWAIASDWLKMQGL